MDIVLSAITMRTGSTLLQRIFNAREGTLIWGEHGGLLEYFHTIRTHAMYWSKAGSEERKVFFEGQEDSNIWTASMTPSGNYVEQAVLCSIKSFLKSLYSEYSENHDRVGFKEVRYGSEVLELLRRCYPNMKIVLLVRNPIHIWRSMPKDWWSSIFEFTEVYSQRATFYQQFAHTDENVFLFRFEDIIKRDATTLDQLTQLAEISRVQLDDVLCHKLNSSKGQIPREESLYISSQCKTVMEQLGYEWAV